MKIFIEIIFSFAIGLISFIFYTRWFFILIPAEWAYAVMDHFGTYGIEELEDTLVDIASLFGLLPAILTGLLVRKVVKRM
ncbi:hypothetical protein [Enterobacter chuandaensis]|uniref:hypothetical protein n=1 Tax=Enterobacter chuandaensis TaxID=2497875 RepID=UPI002FCED785